MKIFHERLKETMKEKKVSQHKLAELLGVSQQSVWEWVNESWPSMERFLQICETLNVRPNFLLGIDSE